MAVVLNLVQPTIAFGWRKRDSELSVPREGNYALECPV
jgi:hypothetical protein